MTTPAAPSATLPASGLGSLTRRSALFFAWFAFVCLVFFAPISRFVHYALSNDNASHAILIPAICAWLLFLERDHIFTSLGSDLPAASGFLFAGALVAFSAFLAASRLSGLNQLSLYVFSLILFWIAGFAFLFGRNSLRRAYFPLAFLLFTIPIPDFALDRAIYLLQKGSAEIAAVLFDWSGVPVLRDGFVFHFARVNIEVAKECSGIRSSLALLILAIIVAHFYLRTFWRQLLFVLAGLFVMILKNGVRIVTLTLLASYVDPGFLYGRLHHEGGFVFFALGLALLAPLLWLLERGERNSLAKKPASTPA